MVLDVEAPALTPTSSPNRSPTPLPRAVAPGVEWLDDDEMRAWRGLVDVFAAVHASLESELAEAFGITEGDYGVLVNLSEAPEGQMRMCDLAERLHLSPSGL